MLDSFKSLITQEEVDRDSILLPNDKYRVAVSIEIH